MPIRPQEPKPLPSTKDLQADYDKAKKELDDAQKAFDSALTVSSRTAAQTRLNTAQDAFNKIDKPYQEAKKREEAAGKAAAAGTKAKEDLIAKAKETIRIRQERVDNARIALERNPSNQALFDKYQSELGNLFNKFEEYDAQGVALPRTVRQDPAGGFAEVEPGKEVTFTPGAPTDNATRAATQIVRNREADPNNVGIESVKVIVKNGVEVKVTTFKDGRTTEVPTGNKVQTSATDTPTGGTSTSVTAPKDKKQAGAPVEAQATTDWENTFKQYFPAKAWLLTDLDRTKYPQLFDLLKRAHDLKYYDTTEGRARFAAELDGTDYYKELASSGKVRQIKSIVGDLGFESTDFSRFVTQAINFGWDDNRLKQETYREVFRRNPDGTYANPTAVARTRQSNEFLSVSLIAKNFFNQASEDTITKVLTGDITTEDFQRQQRTIAKTRYSHLSDLIDQGVTLEDLASNYKTSAAKLLEVDPNSIDMSDAQYEIALAYDGDGGKRTMTTGEWERLLRTDARYGWERTENAKSEARSLASNIAQAFGRII